VKEALSSTPKVLGDKKVGLDGLVKSKITLPRKNGKNN
jgi:hypothetical protein